MKTVTLIPGDGIGPEVAEAMRRCVEATGVDIKWDVQNAGTEVMKDEGTPLPDRVISSIKKNRVAIKGPITTPVGSGFRSVNVALRQELDLYANLRPCKTMKGVKTRFENVDLIVVRENTEDLYAGVEFERNTAESRQLLEMAKSIGKELNEDSAFSLKPISVRGSDRIVEFAFDYAERHDRKKVTAVHKANIMKFTDGLFLESARKISVRHTGIEFEDRIVDNMCMQLVQKPELYDVLVLPNLYGDIVSDLCAGLIGGLGVAPGANFGEDHALFEAVHGSAPKYKGLNKVNPTGMILSGVLMLHHLNEVEAANNLENAVARVIAQGKKVTYDLKPTRDDPTAVGTKEMADAIIKELNR